MVTLSFTIEIKASPQYVWFALWNDTHYRKWVAAFSEGSHARSDWQQGSKVHFLNVSGDGIYSTIEALVPNQRMVFRHMGAIKNYEEQPLDEQTKAWSGSTETYTLTVNGDITTLTATIDTVEEYKGYFESKFPVALALLKNEAEQMWITVRSAVRMPLATVWDMWNLPQHITSWAFASDDWHCPAAYNDLKTGGKFTTTMAAKNGSFSFDFSGTYTEVMAPSYIAYTMDDGRKATITFSHSDGITHIEESFQPEGENTLPMQQAGWQAILDNFKKYAESE